MEREKRVITRRDFIRAGSCMAVGSLMALPMLGNSPIKKTGKSRVVLVRDENVLDSHGRPDSMVLQKMFDHAVTTLLDATDPLSAWQQLVKPVDIVGIKSNVWHHLPTPKPLEDVIRKGLIGAGVKNENIAVDDRGVRRNPVFNRSTALINVRPMRTHHWSGLGTLIKNYIMFIPNPSEYHGNACEKLGAIWQLPHIRGKTVLNILVMITPQFHGIGPHNFSRRHTWKYGGLIISTDPVAADATGARIIQAKRNEFFGKERPISPPPLHIVSADTRFGLGNSRPDQIEVIRLGRGKEILV
ncbi:DUF362 domain-containing protein [Thermodesulfobacteriota bacterium]